MHELFPASGPSRRVVVLHDLSPLAGHASWRAAMIARDHGASVLLLHVAAAPVPAGQAQRLLARLAAQLSRQLGVPADVKLACGDPVTAVASLELALVVLGARRANVLREWVCGTPADRLIRLGRFPVLVVRKPANARYRRVLVPVDFGPASRRAVGAALALTHGVPVEVFHTLAARDEITLRAAEVPEAVIRHYRHSNAERARQRIAQLVAAVPGAGGFAVPSIGFGPAWHMVLAKERAMAAELVVIGKRRRGLLADSFLGGVTRRVMAAGRSDVLALTAVERARHPPLAFDRQPAWR